MAELSKLGRYELRRVLGTGAMGVVYEGFDPTLSRRVAVKTVLKSVALDPETERAYSARFIQEAKAVARLNHPNIVQVHDFGVEGNVAYLVMEFVEGRELRSFFDAKEKFEPAEAVRIMGELLDALDFAHGKGVIHRDVKPANVMLDAQRRAKLADFGVARIQDSDRSMGGTMVGTPAFMSPEQVQGRKVDRRTDIFSAGTILYQLLTGEQPFKGEGAWTVAKRIVEDDPAPPSRVVSSVSPAFDAIVDKALAKLPAQRFESARDFSAALRGVLTNPQQSPAVVMPKPKAKAESRASEAEVEFWRSIQNSTDAAEFETYLQEFPQGTYAQLARVKMAKLLEPIEAARKEREEKARVEAEASARREAEERAKREVEEKTRLQRQAKEEAAREAAAKARLEAEAKAKREAEEKVRQAQVLARLKQQEEAAARAKAAIDTDATVAFGSVKATATSSGSNDWKRSPPAVAVIAAVAVLAGGIAAYLLLGRMPAPVPVVEAPPVKKDQIAPVAPGVDLEKMRREAEERLRKEFEQKAAAEKVAAERAEPEKLASAKTAAEKETAEKAAQKAAVERIAAEKAAAEKAAASRAVAEKAAAERLAAEKVASDKALSERAAAEKTASEKAVAEKVTAAKVAATAAKPGWPNPGDRWIYEARDANRPEKKYQIIVDVKAVTSSAVRDVSKSPGTTETELTHSAGAYLVGTAPGIVVFSPYLRAFQELRTGGRWSDIDFKNLGRCSAGIGDLSCNANVRIGGREKVTVKSGTYDAWKIEVEIILHPTSREGYMQGQGTVSYTYWFSEEVHRYVKYQSRTHGVWLDPEINMELESFVPVASR